MRPLVVAFLAGAMLVAGPADGGGELHIYNWQGYTSPMTLERFAQAHDVAITLDDYKSNDELLASVRAGNTGYDIVVPSDWAVQVLIEENLLAKTDPNQMENFRYVDPRWIDVFWDPGRSYSVPYHWGTTGLAVNTAVYTGDVNTLKLLFEPPPELQGRVAVVDSSVDVLRAALRYLGKRGCAGAPEDLNALNEVLTGAKRHWRSITYDVTDSMLSGEVALVFTWNGNVMGVRQRVPTWKYLYPREGITGWMDNVVVLRDAPNLENAKLFQNFVMDPHIAAINSASNGYANAIPASGTYMPAEFAAAPEMTLPDDAPTPEIAPACAQAVQDTYNEIWRDLTN